VMKVLTESKATESRSENDDVGLFRHNDRLAGFRRDAIQGSVWDCDRISAVRHISLAQREWLTGR
jgi:hypothetical protein